MKYISMVFCNHSGKEQVSTFFASPIKELSMDQDFVFGSYAEKTGVKSV